MPDIRPVTPAGRPIDQDLPEERAETSARPQARASSSFPSTSSLMAFFRYRGRPPRHQREGDAGASTSEPTRESARMPTQGNASGNTNAYFGTRRDLTRSPGQRWTEIPGLPWRSENDGDIDLWESSQVSPGENQPTRSMASRDMMFPQQINEWARECATDSDNWYDGWMSQVRRLHGIEPDARLALQQTAGILKSVEDRQNPQLNLQFVPIPRFPPNLSPLAHLQHISIAGGGLQSLPESIDTLQDLRSMNLSRNPLRALPDSLANLANLNTLLIVGSPLLTALPDNLVRRDATGALQGLVNLEALTLIDTGLTALPRSVMRMSKLKTLTLSKSPIEDLPNDIDRLRQLQTLQLDSTPIAWIRPSVAQLPQLRNLSLRNCRELRSLPENIGDLQALRFLDLTGCYRLQTLPPSLAHLRPDCEIRVPPRLQAELHLLRAPAPSVTLVNPAVQARLEQIDSASQWMMDLVMSDEKNPFLHGCPPFLPAPATGDPRMTLGDIPAVRTMLTESGYMEKRNALEHNSSMRNFQTDTPLNVASLGAAVTMWRAREMAIARNPSLVEIFPHLPVDLPPNLQCPDVPRPPLALPNPQEQVTLD